MPQPIIPVSKLSLHESLFDFDKNYSDNSAVQDFAISNRIAESSTQYDSRLIDLLEKINKNEDELITAASSIKTNNKNKYYKVPRNITDNEVLSLKAAGLLTGGGRTVQITERGVIALRNRWLNESNKIKTTRTKNTFDYRTSNNIYNSMAVYKSNNRKISNNNKHKK